MRFAITLVCFIGLMGIKCHAQEASSIRITPVETIKPVNLYIEEFKWSITTPENYSVVPKAEWEKMQNRGVEAVQNTYDIDSIPFDPATTLFALRNGQLNYMEANYQPFDTEVDGDYLESFQAFKDMMSDTFRSQMPGATVEPTLSTESISGLTFNKCDIKVTFPNGMMMHSITYGRLFDKKDFTLNILYVDEEEGAKMLKAWRNSKFD